MNLLKSMRKTKTVQKKGGIPSASRKSSSSVDAVQASPVSLTSGGSIGHEIKIVSAAWAEGAGRLGLEGEAEEGLSLSEDAHGLSEQTGRLNLDSLDSRRLDGLPSGAGGALYEYEPGSSPQARESEGAEARGGDDGLMESSLWGDDVVAPATTVTSGEMTTMTSATATIPPADEAAAMQVSLGSCTSNDTSHSGKRKHKADHADSDSGHQSQQLQGDSLSYSSSAHHHPACPCNAAGVGLSCQCSSSSSQLHGSRVHSGGGAHGGGAGPGPGPGEEDQSGYGVTAAGVTDVTASAVAAELGAAAGYPERMFHIAAFSHPGRGAGAAPGKGQFWQAPPRATSSPFAAAGRRVLGRYELRETLGRGYSGKVKLGVDVQTGALVALKIMEKSLSSDPRSMQKIRRLQDEVEAMQRCGDHPNIVRLLPQETLNTRYPKRNGSFREALVLVLELCPRGELFDLLFGAAPVPPSVCREYFCQLMDGISYCHKRGVFHRDLKPENLLLDNNYGLKVADFGLCALTDSGLREGFLCRSRVGSEAYMAPEVVSGKTYNPAKADIWSAGIILFTMLAGHPPLEVAASSDWWYRCLECTPARYDIFWKAHSRTAPSFPQLAKDLISCMLIVAPDDRASLAEIMAHPYLRDGPSVRPGTCSQTLHDEMDQRWRQAQARKRRRRMLCPPQEPALAGAATVTATATATGTAVDPFRLPVYRGEKEKEEKLVRRTKSQQ